MSVTVDKIAIDKKQLQRQFGRAARTYDQHAQMQYDIAVRLAEELPDMAEEVISTVDLGCGTGVGIKLLYQRYPKAKLTGIDIASEMLEVAKESYPFAQFEKQDIEKLSLPSGTVDLLFSSSALQWCDAERVLSECYRVLKPGGYLVFSTFLHGTLAGWRELWMSEQQMQNHRFLTRATILQILHDTGFSVMGSHQQLITQKFSTFKQAATSIKALGAGTAVKTKQAGLMGKQKYLRLKSKLEQQLSASGAINLDYQAGYFVLSKGSEQNRG